MRTLSLFLIISLTALAGCITTLGAVRRPKLPPQFNYNEAKVPAYTLPDPFICRDGTLVKDATVWREKRRPEILSLFETEMYGRPLQKPQNMTFTVRSCDSQALSARATRKQVTITVNNGSVSIPLEMLIYQPNNVKGPIPVFVALNFYGNQVIINDPGITLNPGWVKDREEFGIPDHQATEKSRGAEHHHWPVERILSRGYALATLCYGDLDPDFDDGFRNGVHALFFDPNRNPIGPEDAGAIGAWAWGLSRMLDYIETDSDLDARRVAVLGHSRLGKAALWAGACDERFAMVISNDSGCCGAALSRRRFGETLMRIGTKNPHWFCANFQQYRGKENELPVDQHELIALIAPRPVYIASASEDLWADPRGEFLAAKAADPVYRMLKTSGLPAGQMPPVNRPVMGTIGYHVRKGVHELTEYDWLQYLDFADRYLKQNPTADTRAQ